MALGNIMRGRRDMRGRGGFRGRGRGMARGGPGVGNFRGPGASMPYRRPLGVDTRPSSYKIAKSFKRTMDNAWRPDLYENGISGGGEEGAKLFVSNLDFGVSNKDIKELFSEIGELKRYGVHFDSQGRPNGTAEVVFVRRHEAMAALKRYNNVQLDGKPMRIELIGGSNMALSARVNLLPSSDGRLKRTVVMMPEVRGRGRGPPRMANGYGRGRGGFRQGGINGISRGRGVGGRGGGGGRGGVRGRGRGVWRKVEKSVADLDKELDKYHAKAMDTS